MKKILLLSVMAFASQVASSQNVGIGESNPASKGSIKGNLSVGNNYSTTAAPANGAIIEGSVGIGTPSPNGSTVLDMVSTNKGVSFPNVAITSATDNTTIPSPVRGLVIFNPGTSFGTAGLYFNSGTTGSPSWVRLSDANTGVQSLGVVSPLSTTGGLNPTISIAQANGTTNGFLAAADWTIFNNKLGTSLSNGRVWIGDGSNVAQPTAITGDATLSNTGVLTLANSGVTAGAYGSATTVPIVTVDAKGRITGVTTTTISGVAPGGAAGGDLTGTYPNPTIASNAVTTAKIADGTVDNADLANMAALSVKGNAANAAAVPTDIAAANDNEVLRRSGTSIGFGSVNLASSSAVTGILPVANGGTGSSSQNWVDLTTTQTAAGVKTWSNNAIFNDNVGIGTTSPGRKLEVNNAMKFTNSSSDPNDGVIGTAPFASGLNIVGINTDAAGRKINFWGSFIQNENGTANSFIGNTNFPSGIWNSSGRVGIGTATPTLASLDVNPGAGGLGGSASSTAIKFGSRGFLLSPSTIIADNAYWNGTGFANVATDFSTYMSMSGGAFRFNTSPAAASPTFTEQVNISAIGLTLGTNKKLVFGNGSSMSKAPYTVTFSDNRAGCPPAAAANTDLFGGSFTLNTTATINIIGSTIHNVSGRNDLYLMVDGVEQFRAISMTYTIDYQTATVHWSGSLTPGAHTVYVRGSTATAWGCGAGYGRIDIQINEQ